jgi:hypothetical protein
LQIDSWAAENSSMPQPLLIERKMELSHTRFISGAQATLIFAVALVATPTKAHASIDSFLTIDGGGGNDGGSSGSGVGGSTLTGWFVQMLDAIGIR